MHILMKIGGINLIKHVQCIGLLPLSPKLFSVAIRSRDYILSPIRNRGIRDIGGPQFWSGDASVKFASAVLPLAVICGYKVQSSSKLSWKICSKPELCMGESGVN